MNLFSKQLTMVGLMLALLGTGSFSSFDMFRARLLGNDMVTEVEAEVETDGNSTTVVVPDPITTGDASTSVTVTNNLNGEDVDQTVTVSETTGGETVTVVYPDQDEETEEDSDVPAPSSMFQRFKARFSF